MGLKNGLRFCFIGWTIFRFGLNEFFFRLPFLRKLHYLRYTNPFYFSYHRTPRAVRLRQALEELGPIFVKFGQILSTRRDFLPDDIANELAKLQDQVPPFSGAVALSIIEKALHAPLPTFYQHVDLHPLASASIAQVHAATLLEGTPVVIKVLRPHIQRVIKKDIALLKILAKWVERYWSEGPRLKPRDIVAEFETTLMNELDLLREAANASQLRRNFKDSPLLYIPQVYWPLCRTNVMTMERINAIPVDDIPALKRARIDLEKLSERGVEIFFTQVFRDNFFHADMHPGNIFVSDEHPENPQYMGVDFGIMGTLSESDKRYLAENFLAFFNRDYTRVAQLHIESGWVPAHTRIDQFESAIRAVCEPIFERPLKDISFGQLLVRLFQTAGQFNMPVQPQLILLQKTLLNVEGLGRQLNPDLDLWKTAKPFLEKFIKKQMGLRAFIRRMREYAPYWIEKFPELPVLLDRLKQNAPTPVVIRPTRQPFFYGLGMGCLIGLCILLSITSSHLLLLLFAGLALLSFLLGWLCY